MITLKKGLFTCAIFCFTTLVFSQTNSFSSSDIDGTWKALKEGKEIVLEIKQNVGIITSVEGTSIPRDLLNGKLYENIQFQNGHWTAIRNKWIYPGANGDQAEKGHWEKGEQVELQLNASKDQLTAVGHWTYKRLKNTTITSNQENSKEVSKEITENYGELKATYRTLNQGSKKTIFAQFKNTSTTRDVTLQIKTTNGQKVVYQINPGGSLTTRVEDSQFEIQYSFEKANLESDFDLFQYIKSEIRKIVTDENGEPKSSYTGFGVRG